MQKTLYNGKLTIVTNINYSEVTIYYDKDLEQAKLDTVRKAVREAQLESKNAIIFKEVPRETNNASTVGDNF